ncbi:hypothetical protein [Phreatobacter stygius]|uniref:Uncharacterized protein n=1 Tax=Phreatobacter stygius TaxID=1940610 RepID=A0A4D7B5P9_9HYPH|nr:hypothetical protein [Phreatobacter stygius]QCI65046.1 hypothetical protein E8M01_12950 [Phreatobacter stygius]
MSSIATSIFRTTNPVTLLRRVLAFDAVTSGAMGLMLILGAGLLEPLLAIPKSHLMLAGAILVPFALGVGLAAARAELSRKAIWAIVIINALWVIESFAVLFAGAISPNVLGVAFVVAQAVFVAVLAELQVIGLKLLARG